MYQVNNISRQSVTRMLLGLAALAYLTGCGASSKPRDGAMNLSSTANLTTQVPTSAGAECNSFDSRDTRLQGRVTTYYYNGVLQDDRVRVRITAIADQFSYASSYLQFFRWQVDSSGNTQLDQTPLTFSLEAGSPSRPISGTMTTINENDIANFRASAGIPGTTAQDFFNNVTVVVTGVDYQWSTLKIVLYDGSASAGQADVLLPPYTANPNTFAQYHASTLGPLHPFWAIRSQGLSDADWVSRARSFCF
jgi:hypothetical protein